MSETGAIFYRGPSLLTGDPIVGVLIGLDRGSQNAKTGPMAQAYVLRSDVSPMDAKRRNLDDAICGDCQLRGRDGLDSGCYVTVWHAPRIVFEGLVDYLEPSWPELQALVEGRSLRIAAYGDPAAVPFEIWRMLLVTASGWTAYSHAWKSCDQRLKLIAMASVDTVDEAHTAWRLGWRTFRIRRRQDALLAPSYAAGLHPPFVNQDDPVAEFMCPASDEGGYRTTCEACQLCRGTCSPARSVAIYPHGKPSNLKVFGAKLTARFPTAIEPAEAFA